MYSIPLSHVRLQNYTKSLIFQEFISAFFMPTRIAMVPIGSIQMPLEL